MAEDLSISIGAHDNGALSTIKQLNNQLKFLDREYQTTRKSSKNFDSTLQGQRAKLDYLKNSYNTTAKKLETYKKAMEKAKQTLDQKKAALEQVKQAEGDNAAAIEKAENAVRKAENTLHTAQQNIVLTEASLNTLRSQIEQTNNSIRSNPLEQYKKKMNELGDSFEKTGLRISKFGQGMSTVGDGLLKLSAPFIALSAYATKIGVEFEKAVAKLGATSGASAAQMDELRESSIKLGEEIKGASATDVANSYNYLAMAGYDVNEMMAAIEPNVKASIAYGSDMATTADLTTDSLSALGLTAQDTGRYLDVVSQASRRANTTGTGLMEAYIGCGGMFRELNVPIEESATLLSLLA